MILELTQFFSNGTNIANCMDQIGKLEMEKIFGVKALNQEKMSNWEKRDLKNTLNLPIKLLFLFMENRN